MLCNGFSVMRNKFGNHCYRTLKFWYEYVSLQHCTFLQNDWNSSLRLVRVVCDISCITPPPVCHPGLIYFSCMLYFCVYSTWSCFRLQQMGLYQLPFCNTLTWFRKYPYKMEVTSQRNQILHLLLIAMKYLNNKCSFTYFSFRSTRSMQDFIGSSNSVITHLAIIV